MGRQIELPEDVDTFGKAIRYLREQKGMSLRALAKAVDLSAPFLSDVEHGRRATDKIQELAEALGVDREVLDDLDARIPRDVEEWIKSNPQLSRLLREMKNSGRSVAELRRAFRKPDTSSKT